MPFAAFLRLNGHWVQGSSPAAPGVAVRIRCVLYAARASAAHFVDHFVKHRGATLERVASNILIRLMRLLQIAGPAYQRHDTGACEPSAVGAVQRAAAVLRA